MSAEQAAAPSEAITLASYRRLVPQLQGNVDQARNEARSERERLQAEVDRLRGVLADITGYCSLKGCEAGHCPSERARQALGGAL